MSLKLWWSEFKDWQKAVMLFSVGMPVSVWTAWWWFGDDKPWSFGLLILHAFISAATVALGLIGLLGYMIEQGKK